MIVVKVTYSVKPGYVITNKEAIENFLTDFKKLDSSQFLHSVFQIDGENTFVHLSQYQNKHIQQALLNTESFLKFQQQRDQNLASEPQIEFLNFIGSSKKVF